MLADPRLTSMWYGKIFLASLPKRDYRALGAGEALRIWREQG